MGSPPESVYRWKAEVVHRPHPGLNFWVFVTTVPLTSLPRQLARQGAHVAGVDASAPIIERAQQREVREPLGIVYHVADAARMEPLGDGQFDLGVSCMALQDIPDTAGAIREAARVLKPMGRLVALFSHPCFDVPQASS
jgi:ubiquinone/menaquinone biosynthesis C-methylase UbiE